MAFYIINHKVTGFDIWEKVYDEFEETWKNFGVKEHFAFQNYHPVILKITDREVQKKGVYHE